MELAIDKSPLTPLPPTLPLEPPEELELLLPEDPEEELEDIILWCIEVGLPVTLAELGAGNVTDEQLMEVAKTACAENDTLHNMPFEVTPETVFAAIKAADAYGKYYLGEE